MKRKTLVTLSLVVALVAIFVVSFALGSRHGDNPEERFGGTDSIATSQIQESNPDYKPWFSPFFEPASGEIESGLFSLQAALGGSLLGFAIGALWGRRRAERDLGVQANTVEEAITPAPQNP